MCLGLRVRIYYQGEDSTNIYRRMSYANNWDQKSILRIRTSAAKYVATQIELVRFEVLVRVMNICLFEHFIKGIYWLLWIATSFEAHVAHKPRLVRALSLGISWMLMTLLLLIIHTSNAPIHQYAFTIMHSVHQTSKKINICV